MKPRNPLFEGADFSLYNCFRTFETALAGDLQIYRTTNTNAVCWLEYRQLIRKLESSLHGARVRFRNRTQETRRPKTVSILSDSPAPMSGPELHALRLSKNISQKDLCNTIGVSDSVLCEVEKGLLNFTPLLWRRALEAIRKLETPMEYTREERICFAALLREQPTGTSREIRIAAMRTLEKKGLVKKVFFRENENERYRTLWALTDLGTKTAKALFPEPPA